MTARPTSEGLLPCPFCGSAASMSIHWRQHHPDEYDKMQKIECDCCDLRLICDTEAEVTAAWNTRALAQRGSEGAWLPIESAPYSTNVLAWLYLPKNPIASGWTIAQRCFVEVDEPESYGEDRLTVGCWWNGRYLRPGTDGGYIMAWHPLPAAPAGGEADGPVDSNGDPVSDWERPGT